MVVRLVVEYQKHVEIHIDFLRNENKEVVDL